MILQLLGRRTPSRFLAHYWQKRPLLIRGAVPGFRDLIEPVDLFSLTAGDAVESRLVLRQGARWSLEHGPFARRRLTTLPKARWTLLVQGLNLHLDSADRLLRRFAFIPQARLDDVMVSYAAPGGGVGPHVDSYDVFLLQGRGRRRWRIAPHGEPRAGQLLAHAPLKILRKFKPAAEYVLEAGDMLYLPPGWAHDGVAMDWCSTYSIGFRAPARRELMAEFLLRFSERVAQPAGAGRFSGHYADPGLKPARQPAALPAAMVDELAEQLARLRFTRRDMADFLGGWLSEPKPRVVFERPRQPLSPLRFGAALRARGARLDRGSLMLTSGYGAYINGESCDPSAAGGTRWLQRLADQRALPPGPYGQRLCRVLHDWYLHGWLHIGALP